MAVFLIKKKGRVPSRNVNDFGPGVHHYVRASGQNKKRIHLRVDPDGSGVLVVNASMIYHFNPSAAWMAFLILEDIPEMDALQATTDRFRVSKKQAAVDYLSFKDSFNEIISPDSEACPICDLNLDMAAPFSMAPSAPYRMDLALTYRCNNACIHCYNEPGRSKQELDLSQWKEVLSRIWDAAIPHVVFTGGEPTLVDFLPELVSYAEGLGLITGLNTNGRLLADPAYLEGLVSAGLDHVQITIESHDAGIHDRIVALSGAHAQTAAGIRNALQTRLFVMTNTTLLKTNSPYLQDTLTFLQDLAVPTIGLNGLIHSGRGVDSDQSIEESQLHQLLEIARSHVAGSGQKLIWYTPTQYCHFNPLECGLGVKGCTAARYNMAVEPDGSVLPCQSYYQPLGNILADEWQGIWHHDLAVSIRERRYVPDGCRDCDLLDTCGGGCPLYLDEHPQEMVQPIQAVPF
jgi:radical SAM protein with 4Fe4S-binding SPASM domain